MRPTARWLHKQLPGIVGVIAIVGVYLVSMRPTPSAAETAAAADGFGFQARSIALPSGFDQQEIRKVNQDYRKIDAWISSVGAGIAMNDLDGDGLPDDLCISDPRIDQVVITPAPGARGDRYQPFALDGDGHVDIYIGNHFPDSPVLDHTVAGGVEMNRSLSNADNGGESYFFELTGATAGPEPSVSFQRHDDVLPEAISRGWDLAAAANDLDGDQRPELYIANDHGPDALLHNRSTPGAFRFEPVYGAKSPLLPKSRRVGADSFKGMGIDFGDLDGDGMFDMFVSNITTSFGIQETNFQYTSDARDLGEVRRELRDGNAPWTDRSTDVHIGLGEVDEPVPAEISWRDRDGTARQDTVELQPGWHELELGSHAEEK